MPLTRTPRPLRVAVISHSYVIKANRGKLDALAQLHDVQILLLVPRRWRNRDTGERFEVEARKESHLLAPLRAWSRGSGSLITYDPFALVRELRRFGPDLVHLEEEPWSVAALQLVWICRRLNVPFAFFTWENSNRRLPLVFQLMQRWVLRRASAAVAGNAEAQVRLERLGFRKPVVVLPQLGVNASAFCPAPVDAKSKEKIVGFVGRLVPQKGLLLLVEAVARLSSDVRLVVVGRGPLKAELLRRAHTLRLDGRLELHERVPHREVPQYLQQMSILVLPSLTTSRWKEQFGHVLIEAMACGVPVIGSDSGAIPGVLGDAGIIVPERDVGALASALDKLLSDPGLRERLASRGRTRVLAMYTDEVIANHLIGFWKSVIQQLANQDREKASPVR